MSTWCYPGQTPAAAAAVPAAEAGHAALGLAFHQKPAALWKLQTQLGWDPLSPSAPLQFACMLVGAAQEVSLHAAIGCKNESAHAQRAYNFIST